MARTSIGFEVHVIDKRTGIWCDACALPSVVEVDATLVNARTLTVAGRKTCWRCTDCGRCGIRERSDT